MTVKSFGEHRVFTPDGVPALLQAGHEVQVVLILSDASEVKAIGRHWDEGIRATRPCTCEPPCPSHRLDIFAASLLRLSATEWEERLLILSYTAWHSLLLALARNGAGDDPRGALFKMRRTGDRQNGRVVVELIQVMPKVPPAFDLGWAMNRKLGLSADFFGRNDLVEEMGKAGSKKPRVPLGTPKKG